MSPERYLLTVSGRDRPGLARGLVSSLEHVCGSITDVGQITIRGHLVLCIEVEPCEGIGLEEIAAAVTKSGIRADGTVSVEIAPSTERAAPVGRRILVTLVAPSINAANLAAVFTAIDICGGDVERIVRLADYPVQSYELLVRDPDPEQLRAALVQVAVDESLDVAVQRAGLHRRAKRLIVMDVDSTLLQGEVIDQLAAKLGVEDQVAAITEAAMAGELDFAEALIERVALLAGLSADELISMSYEL